MYQPNVAPSLSDTDIEREALDVFRCYQENRTPAEIVRLGYRFRDVFERVLRPRYGIEIMEDCDLGTTAENHKILGAFDFMTGTVFTDKIAGPTSQNPKRTFMLYHETVGHGVLQGQFLREHFACIGNAHRLEETDRTLTNEDRRLLEVQANKAAAVCAAPMVLVDAAIEHYLEASVRAPRFVGPCCYSVGSANCFISTFEEFCRVIAGEIQPSFDGLSKQALGYRVQRSCWVHNEVY